MTWTNSKMGRGRDLGLLHLGLFADPEPFRWTLFIYLRKSVTVGVLTWTDRLAIITFKGGDEASAEVQSEVIARQWIESNADALCAGTLVPI